MLPLAQMFQVLDKPSMRFTLIALLLLVIFAVSCGNPNNMVDDNTAIPKIPEDNVKIKIEPSAPKPGDEVKLEFLKVKSQYVYVNYLWMQLSGTAVEIKNADTAQASFIAPMLKCGETETLVFELYIRSQIEVKERTLARVMVTAKPCE